jgi:hypothetical protein
MKIGAGMVAVPVLSMFVITGLAPTDAVREAWLGMLGPSLVAAVEWIAIERAFRRDPGAVTGVMLRMFAGKMVFFGGYVILLFGSMALSPVPFVVSFVGYFLTLMVVEAFFLGRLTRIASVAGVGSDRTG